MARITLENIGFRYPGAESDTLSGLDIDIADGEPYLLLGASGAGKTTLMNLLSGLLSPTEGSLKFTNRDAKRRRRYKTALGSLAEMTRVLQRNEIAQLAD